jgi:hypothetical protein
LNESQLGRKSERYTVNAAEHSHPAAGLDCPPDVFEQLFHDHDDDPEIGRLLRFVNWAAVSWEEGALSGVALRHTSVPRPFQRAVDEARQETARDGFHDDRSAVMTHKCRRIPAGPSGLAAEAWL